MRTAKLNPEQEARVVNLLNKGWTLKQVQSEIGKEGISMTEMGLSLVRKRFRILTNSAKQLEKMVTSKRVTHQIKAGEICDRTILVGTEIIRMKMEEIHERMTAGDKVSNYELYMVNSFMKTMSEVSKSSTPQFEVTQSQIYQNLQDRYLKKEENPVQIEIPAKEEIPSKEIKEEIKEEKKEEAPSDTSSQASQKKEEIAVEIA